MDSYTSAARQISRQQLFPSFVALRFVSNKEVDPSFFQIFSPRVMHWHDDIWLLDLRVCRNYWVAQALAKQVEPMEILRQALAELCGRVGGGRAAQGGGYQAAFAYHPWQAVMLMGQMMERGLSGLIEISGVFGRNLFQETSWDVFWSHSQTTALHLENLPGGRRRYSGDKFLRQMAKMQRAVKRLGVKSPWHLHSASPLSIKRRYGAIMSDLWSWSFSELGQGEASSSLLETKDTFVFDSGFPWHSHQFADMPKTKRCLETPLLEWEHIKPFLQEDLNRLCTLSCWDESEKVVSLEWRIVFQDLSYLTIPVSFRHPHSLHKEKTHQSTALLQALYSFQASITGSPLDWRRLDDEMTLEPIISWELEVTEKMSLPDHWSGLFGELSSLEEKEELALLRLENRLPVVLGHYQVKKDWVPEDGFYENKEVEDVEFEKGCFTKGLASMAALGKQRPLFILREPRRFLHDQQRLALHFTERTMAKWWQETKNGERGNIQRDYYRVIDRDGRAYWFYQEATTSGSTKLSFIHGMFH